MTITGKQQLYSMFLFLGWLDRPPPAYTGFFENNFQLEFETQELEQIKTYIELMLSNIYHHLGIFLYIFLM